MSYGHAARPIDANLTRLEEDSMDFIERLFGISPDGGTGALELILLLIPVAVIAAIVAIRRNRQNLP
jgi:hypothetical protein